MKKLVLAAIVSAFTFTATADDLPAAPMEVMKEALDACKSWAKEDEVSEAELPKYLLTCVNDELETSGFKKIESLDEIK